MAEQKYSVDEITLINMAQSLRKKCVIGTPLCFPDEYLFLINHLKEAPLDASDTFIEGIYKYTFIPSESGWRCTLSDKVFPIPEDISKEPFVDVFLGYESIDFSSLYSQAQTMVIGPDVIPNPKSLNVKVVGMFSNCKSLKIVNGKIPDLAEDLTSLCTSCPQLIVPPVLSDNAKNLTNAFLSCTGLENFSRHIPKKVTNTTNMFFGCSKLTGDIHIDIETPSVTCNQMFSNTRKPINLIGKNEKVLISMAQTANYHNVTVNGRNIWGKEMTVDLPNEETSPAPVSNNPTTESNKK